VLQQKNLSAVEASKIARQLDTNKDGSISVSELQAALTAQQSKEDDIVILNAFKSLDKVSPLSHLFRIKMAG